MKCVLNVFTYKKNILIFFFEIEISASPNPFCNQIIDIRARKNKYLRQKEEEKGFLFSFLSANYNELSLVRNMYLDPDSFIFINIILKKTSIVTINER